MLELAFQECLGRVTIRPLFSRTCPLFGPKKMRNLADFKLLRRVDYL